MLGLLIALTTADAQVAPTLDEWARLDRVHSVRMDDEAVFFVVDRWHDATTEDEQPRQRSQIWTAPLDGLAPARPYTVTEASSHSPLLSPDGEWLYFLSARDGDDQQVWRMHRGGGEASALTEVEGGVQSLTLGNEGSTVYFTVAEELRDGRYAWLEEGEPDLSFNQIPDERHQAFSLDVDTVGAEPIAITPSGLHCFELAASPTDGRLAALVAPDSRLHSREGWSQVMIFAGEASHTVPDTLWREQEDSAYGWLHGLSWSPDGAALVVGVDWDGFSGEAYTVRVGPDGTPASPERVWRPGDGPHWSGTPRFVSAEVLVGNASDHGRVTLARVRHPFAPAPDKHGCDDGATCQEWTTLTPEPDSALSWDQSDGTFAWVRATPTELSHLVVGEPTGAGQLRFTPNPQAADWALPRLERRTWKSTNNQDVEGLLWLPPDFDGTGKLPLLVNVHGGPTAARHGYLRGSPIDLVPVATGLGYAVLQPNYRGSTGYGDEFLEQLIGHKNDRDIKDIELGVLTLASEGWVDRQRIGIYGWSNGGSITNWAVQASELWSAGVSGAGVADTAMQWALEDTPNHVLNFSQGYPWQKALLYKQKSPLRRAGRVDMPLMLIVGDDDARVPAAHAKAYHRTLWVMGKDVELAVLPGAGHGPSGYDQRRAVGRLILSWFELHLLGHDPDTIRERLHWPAPESDDESAE